MSSGVMLSRLLAAPRIAQALLLGLILALTLAVLGYVHAAGFDTISRDEWRFIEMLRHWYDGSFSLEDVWSTNTAGSEHRVPAFKLYFLANALWWGLDVRIGCYLGVLALGLFAWAMYRYFLRIRPEGEPGAFDHYAFIPVAITLFSMVQSHVYTYDLLAEFAITGSALFGILWMQMDLKLRQSQPPWRYLLFAAALAALLIGFGAGKGPALVLATLVMTGFLASAAGAHRWRVAAWIGGGILAGELVYWWGGAGDKGGSGALRLAMQALGDPIGSLRYMLHALGAAFITSDGLALYAPEQRSAALMGYGAVALAAAVAALLLYLKLRSYRRTLLPLALAVFVAGYVAELVVGRFGAGIDNGGAPRYVYTDHLLVVAVVFVFADTARVLHARGRQQLAGILLLMLTVGVVTLEHHNADIAYHSITSELRSQQRAVEAAKQRLSGQDRPYPAWYCPDDRLCDEGTQFLAEHKLSFMSEVGP